MVEDNLQMLYTILQWSPAYHYVMQVHEAEIQIW